MSWLTRGPVYDSFTGRVIGTMHDEWSCKVDLDNFLRDNPEHKLVEEGRRSIKFRRLDTAVIPTRANPGDAGLDLTATSVSFDEGKYTYGTGLAVEIPEGYVGLLFPRSSINTTGLHLANSVGVIDSGYRGEIKAVFYSHSSVESYQIGDRVAQLVILPCPQFEVEEVEELPDSVRGAQGFGSSGK
jgi:dUTP pyrophosphatase